MSGHIWKSNDDQREPAASDRGKPSWLSSWPVWFFLMIVLVLWLIRQDPRPAEIEHRISYTTFIEQVEAGNVPQITITGDRIQGVFSSPVEEDLENGREVEITQFETFLPQFEDGSLSSRLEQNGVGVNVQPEPSFSWFQGLLAFFPLILIIGLVYFFFSQRRQSPGQAASSMVKSRAHKYEQNAERTTFEDVAGAVGAKQELQEIIQYLKDPGRFQRLGAQIPKGVLLVGPPGTGKTLLARAVAGEAEVPFFSITGSGFMELYVGVGASRVRDLFKQAKQNAPSIVFIDELDSIGRKRGAGLGGGHDEREQTLNQMLSEMDGFEPNENVIVMAATNRPDILDHALLRPGRFDRQISVDLPTLKDRIEILRIHARNKPLAGEVDLEKIGRGTPGFSGADLANLLNEAALLAARRKKEVIEPADLEAARDKVLMGLARENFTMTEEEKRMLAYHEAGHALVAALLPHADPIHKVTIVPHGRAMGVTQQLPERDRYLFSRDYLADRIAVMMGGRAAEELALNTMTSGAADDLKQATHLARRMVLEWGMSERLGYVSLSGEQGPVFLGEDLARQREYSETTAREIDEEVRTILDRAYSRARGMLEQHHQSLERVVEALVDREVILGEELMALANQSPVP